MTNKFERDGDKYQQELTQAAKELHLAAKIVTSLEEKSNEDHFIIMENSLLTEKIAEKLEQSFDERDENYRASEQVQSWVKELVKDIESAESGT